VRDGPWLTSGPLDPGVRLSDEGAIFQVGNAAGEAHPILGEGMSMALQSATLLCSHLLGPSGSAAVPDGPAQAVLHRAYAAAWQRRFAPRLRLAAVFAHLAMRPRSAAALVSLVRWWPGLLTLGARWGGKVSPAEILSRPPASALHAEVRAPVTKAVTTP
jgi:flavin-dependent dehydrogenase